MACALISMMARSTRSKQRPDTLMQDRYLPDRQKPLATHGRTIHPGPSRPRELHPEHRVAGGGRPPPAPTERGVRISRTTLFGSWFTAFTAICSSFVFMVG